jgi:hypothetical protein
VCGGDNPYFVQSMTKWINTHNVFEASYWDYGSSVVTPTYNKLTARALRVYWAGSNGSSSRSPRTRPASAKG